MHPLSRLQMAHPAPEAALNLGYGGVDDSHGCYAPRKRQGNIMSTRASRCLRRTVAGGGLVAFGLSKIIGGGGHVGRDPDGEQSR
jgi:hypothetical protein